MNVNRLIIDTDPGTDDVLAILLALTTAEVLLLSATFGNVGVRQCLLNILTILFNLQNEIDWRTSRGLPAGFDGLTKYSPRVAVGAEKALWDRGEVFDYFNGRDGLLETHTTYPQFNPPSCWTRLFDKTPDVVNCTQNIPFVPSKEPAHKEILRILRENEAGSITLVALGPLTNYALAAAEDPETFLRAKQLVSMGGAVDEPGNVTPVAEFNMFSDPVAAQRVYALTSQLPNTSMPVFPAGVNTGISLSDYGNATFAHQLRLIMMSLDITTQHDLTRGTFNNVTGPQIQAGSPLASWLNSFMGALFDKEEDQSIGKVGSNSSIDLHDPLTIWYLLTEDVPGWNASHGSPEDIRPESIGQWTTGMTVADQRGRARRSNNTAVSSDRGNWLGNSTGNRVYRMLESPGRHLAGPDIMRRLFGSRC